MIERGFIAGGLVIGNPRDIYEYEAQIVITTPGKKLKIKTISKNNSKAESFNELITINLRHPGMGIQRYEKADAESQTYLDKFTREEWANIEKIVSENYNGCEEFLKVVKPKIFKWRRNIGCIRIYGPGAAFSMLGIPTVKFQSLKTGLDVRRIQTIRDSGHMSVDIISMRSLEASDLAGRLMKLSKIVRYKFNREFESLVLEVIDEEYDVDEETDDMKDDGNEIDFESESEEAIYEDKWEMESNIGEKFKNEIAAYKLTLKSVDEAFLIDEMKQSGKRDMENLDMSNLDLSDLDLPTYAALAPHESHE